jgi:nucleotide-binding universal stress UspA family protein
VNGPVICGIEDVNDGRVASVARDLAERYELALFFVHVLHGTDAAKWSLRDATKPGAELVIESGHPADRLIEVAREREASFLVVGNHGPRSSLLGSVSADVSRRAPCPVVVVPRTVETAPATRHHNSHPDVRGGIARFGLGHAVRRMA